MPASWSADFRRTTNAPSSNPFAVARPDPAGRIYAQEIPQARWVKPLVLVDAEFRGKRGEGFLRRASFKGIREDLDIGRCALLNGCLNLSQA
jgi:hypothetical protein